VPEQNRYQIRLEWTATGAAVLAEAGDVDVYVWVDAVGDASAFDSAALPEGGAVIDGSIESAAAVAAWIVELQRQLARRVVVALIAAGDAREDGSTRFTIEDLAAGAIIDQLNKLGLDATSPEAAVAEAAFLQLKPAVSHLVSASVSGRAAGAPFVARVSGELVAADVVVHRHHRLPD
jgi:2-phosphosulfolactate phosphatase